MVSVYQLWWFKSFIPFEYSQPLTLQVLLFAQTLLVFCNSYHKCNSPICSLCFLFILPYFSFLWSLLYSIIFYYSLSKQMLQKCKKNMCFSLKLSLKHCCNGKRIKTDQMLSLEHWLFSISSYNREPRSFIKECQIALYIAMKL